MTYLQMTHLHICSSIFIYFTIAVIVLTKHNRIHTEKVKSVLSHAQVGFHLVVKPLGPLPGITSTAPAVNCDAALQLIYTFLVQLYC